MLTEIYSELRALGVTANYIGFFQVSYAVFLALERPDSLLLVTKWLYPDVAKQYRTTPAAVERNIRKVVDLVWDGAPETLEQLAHHKLTRKPTASQFISILACGITSGHAA
ncbi:MAG: sporulation initiation factor Spo0A C-terminal domain-containing protein [Eubacteriales bacterium]|nr:sporulation initiation factor Spo0A C-terminal domain-containing protein [Eubacteriales bacterium]